MHCNSNIMQAHRRTAGPSLYYQDGGNRTDRNGDDESSSAPHTLLVYIIDLSISRKISPKKKVFWPCQRSEKIAPNIRILLHNARCHSRSSGGALSSATQKILPRAKPKKKLW
jgi:hypothetical protein